MFAQEMGYLDIVNFSGLHHSVRAADTVSRNHLVVCRYVDRSIIPWMYRLRRKG